MNSERVKDMSKDNKITSKILSKLNTPQLIDEMINKLSLSEINSLLMELFSHITDNTEPEDLLRNYSSNHFVKPSAIDPIDYHKLEIDILSEAKEEGVKPVILSPLALLGCCSSIATVNQNKIISALRGTEILSDPTNMLALYLSDGLKNGTIHRTDNEIHICTTHRLTRVQAQYYPGQVPHFGLFCMVSSGKDTGSYNFERKAIKKHMGLYKTFLETKFKGKLLLEIQHRAGYKDSNGFFERISDYIHEEFKDTQVVVTDKDLMNSYYQGVNIKIFLVQGEQNLEIGDAGFVDWTQKLLSSKKERMFISAMALDRLLSC